MLDLRPYQREAIDAFRTACTEGRRRNIIQLPTGTGKTIVATVAAREAIEHLGSGRVLFLTHLDEIAQQTLSKFRLVWPEADRGLVKAEAREFGHRVTVASVQTVQREAALRELVAAGPYDFIVADECHHVASPMWSRVLEAVTLGASQLLGLSATPNRTDGKSLAPTLTEIIYRYSVLEAIEQGYLADVEGRRVHAGINLDELQTRGGDFEVKRLSEMMMQTHVMRKTVQAVHSYAPDRQFILFAASVEHSKSLDEMFRTGGIKTVHVDGTTPSEERRDAVRRFARGEFQGITNYGVFTEGFDCPGINCVVMARPTESDSIYIQMVGRGLRVGPDPRPCLVLDITGNSDRHSIVQLGTLAGITPTKRQIKDIAGRVAIDAPQRELPKHVPSLLAYVHGDQDAERVDVKKAVRTRRYQWVHSRWGYVLDLGKPELGFIILRPVGDSGTLFRVVRIFRAKDDWRGHYEVLTEEAISMDWAVGLAEAGAARFVGGRKNGKWWETEAQWRERPASPQQLGLLRKFGVHDKPENRGAAALLITRAAAERDVADFASTPRGSRARAHLRHILHENQLPPDYGLTEDWQIDQLNDGDARRLQGRMLDLLKRNRGSDAA